MVNTKHLKRYAVPRTWLVPKKNKVWAIKSYPGPHDAESSVPLMIALRDILKIGENASEVRKVLSKREVMLDGKPRMNFKLPVGIMDVISIPSIDRHYRILVNHRGHIVMKQIEKGESSWKLAKIVNKTIVKGGKTQLNLHDGKNLVADSDKYKTGQVLKLSLPDMKILSVMDMKKDSLALLTGGEHIGTICKIKETEKTRNPGPNLVEFDEGFSTIMDYVFVVGEKKSEIGEAEVDVI